MIIYLEGEVNSEMLTTLIRGLNECKAGKVSVYLNSVGGRVMFAEAILDIINKNKDRVVLIGFGEICSSAFDVFFNASCKKELLGAVIGMYHQSTTKVYSDERGKVQSDYDKMMLLIGKTEYRAVTKKTCRIVGMNRKELVQITQGEDVYFSPQRMREMLAHVESKNRTV